MEYGYDYDDLPNDVPDAVIYEDMSGEVSAHVISTPVAQSIRPCRSSSEEGALVPSLSTDPTTMGPWRLSLWSARRAGSLVMKPGPSVAASPLSVSNKLFCTASTTRERR